jgi:6-phosphogluconolactonase
MNATSNLQTFPNADALAETVARLWLAEIATAQAQGRPYRVALSGGRITTKFFADVVSQGRAAGASFDHVQFFWADERCVPPEDKDSNFRMASELLFAPLNIAASQIHRLKGENDPADAAREASTQLARLAPRGDAGQPVLDLVLLGMGEDGHVASLFPGAGADVVACPTPFLVIHNSPKPPPTRLSLSYAAIAAARKIWVLVSGAGKEKALADSLRDPSPTPLGHVRTLRPDAQIFSDL